MLLARYSDRIEIEWGAPVRIVTAYPINKKYKDLEFDFYKEFSDGKSKARNLYSSMMGGYRVAFPGAPMGGYYGNYEATEEDWECLDHRIKCFTTAGLTQSDYNKFVWCFPGFKYVLDKWHSSRALTLAALVIWQEHPEIELLLSAGYENIAFNKSFWRMTEKKRKQVCFWLRKHEFHDYTLAEVLQRMNSNLSDEEWQKFKDWNNHHYGRNISYELYKYLLKQETKNGYDSRIKEVYSDYKKSFQSEYIHHSFDDLYFKFPKNLYEMHTRINDEINNAIALERMQQAEQRKKGKKNCLQRLKRVAEKYSKYNAEIDGYSIFFTSSMKQWNEQAKELHQCIVASNYYEGMANRKYLICFIRRNEKPVATAQIYANKKIGQFYGNELDRNNCAPSDEVKAVFTKWLSGVEVKGAI